MEAFAAQVRKMLNDRTSSLGMSELEACAFSFEVLEMLAYEYQLRLEELYKQLKN